MAGVFTRVEIKDGKVVRTELGPLASSLLSEIYPQENMLERTKREYEEAQYELVRLKQETARYQQETERSKQEIARNKQEIGSPEKWVVKAVHAFLSLGKDIPYIAGIFNLSIEETYSLAQQIPHK